MLSEKGASSGPSEVRSLAVAFQAMSQRLVELDERRELMLAGLSHDLRSPLARMRVAIDLLESSDAGLIGQITTDVEEIDRIVAPALAASLNALLGYLVGPIAGNDAMK